MRVDAKIGESICDMNHFNSIPIVGNKAWGCEEDLN
jgi:hypothetical protein